MIRFNFFADDKQTLLKNFCKYFCLNETRVLLFLMKNRTTVTPNLFSQEFNLDLNNYDCKKIELVCRHITTIADEDFDDFKAKGILDLLSVLQTPTPLSKLLLQNGIQINVKEKLIVIHKMKIPLGHYENLQLRNLSKDVAKFYEFENSVKSLCVELYHRKGVANFFVNASRDEIIEYSCLSRHPEILIDIDKILQSISTDCTTNLCRQWQERKASPYIFEFKITLSQFDVPKYTWHGLRDINSQQCLILSGYDDEDLEQKRIPKNVLNNMRFLEWFIYIYLNNSPFDSWLRPAQKIHPSKIINIVKVN